MKTIQEKWTLNDGNQIPAIGVGFWQVKKEDAKRVVKEALETADTVTVDLQGVERIDETAMERLACVEKTARARGKRVEIVGENEAIRTRMRKYFLVF